MSLSLQQKKASGKKAELCPMCHIEMKKASPLRWVCPKCKEGWIFT